MKNVLMLHYKLHFYRIPIYNKLAKELNDRGINFYLWPIAIDAQEEIINFNIIQNKKLNYLEFSKLIKGKKITHIINFLQMRNPGYFFYAYSILLPKFFGIKIIFYGHGMNLKYRNSAIIKNLYNFLYLFFDRLIIYTPNEKKLFWNKHQKKISVAYNTLNLANKKNNIDYFDKSKIKNELNIKHSKLVLFSGRIESRKKLEVLINLFKRKKIHPEVGLVIVGPGIKNSELEEIKNCNNIYYLGPVYNETKISQIFYISDIFCIPGHIGLGLVEALFWGLPVITTRLSYHAPEIFYLRDGYNGFILSNELELKTKINEVLLNDKYLIHLSKNAIQTYQEKANLDNMLHGFIKSII